MQNEIIFLVNNIYLTTRNNLAPQSDIFFFSYFAVLISERKMSLLGSIANALAIAAGGLLGVAFRSSGIKKYNATIMHALGLAVALIGVQSALKAQNILLVIISLALGSLFGEMLKIENRLEALGKFLEAKFMKKKIPDNNSPEAQFDGEIDEEKIEQNAGKPEGIAEGFITASLVYCVGSMAIIGSLESGLTGNHKTLFAKAVIDGIASIIFASTMGIGVAFSAVSVFIYQGTITIGSSFMRQLLVPEVVNEMSAIGGLLITAIGLKMLEIKQIKIGNMLPAVFIPLGYYLIKTAVGF